MSAVKDIIKKIFGLVIVLMSIFLTGCSFLFSPPPRVITIHGRVTVPANVNPHELTVISFADVAEVGENGTFSVTAPNLPWQLLLVEKGGQPILMGYALNSSQIQQNECILSPHAAPSAETIEISSWTTALALVFMHPLFWDVPVSERAMLLEEIASQTEFSSLVEMIETALAQNENPFKNTAIYEKGVEIAENTFKQLTLIQSGYLDSQESKVTLSSRTFRMRDDAPWIEDKPPDKIDIVNPKCVYYVAGFYDYDNGVLRKLVAIDNRDWIWWRLPPGLEENTRTTTIFDKGSRFKIVIDKGLGHLSSQLWEDKVVYYAALINASSAVIKIIDVFIPVSIVITEDAILGFKKTLPIELVKDVMKVVRNFLKNNNAGQVNDIFNKTKILDAKVLDTKILDFLKGLVGIILEWAVNEKANQWEKFYYWLYQEGKLAISEHAAKLKLVKGLKILLKILDVVEKVWFYLDLLFAPIRVEYNLERANHLTYIPEVKEIYTEAIERTAEGIKYDFKVLAIDLDGKIVKYQWDFDALDGVNWDVETDSPFASHTFIQPGTYLVRVRAWDNANSWALGKKLLEVQVEERCPDIVAQEIWIEPAQFVPGQRVKVWFRAKNVGNVAAGPFRIALQLDDETIDYKNIERLAIGSLLADYFESNHIVWPDSDCHAFRIILDDMNAVPECNEKNNIISRTFCPIQGCPDLKMEDIWLEPMTFTSGQKITIWLRFRNVGNMGAGPFRIILLLDGKEIDAGTVNGLAAGGELRGYKDDFVWPDADCHTIEVRLDPEDAISECQEDNNRLLKRFCPSAAAQFPDLVVENIELEVESYPPPWTTFNVIVTIRNIGSAIAQGPFDVDLYRFEQPITGDWEHIGTTVISQLAPGQSYQWTWCCLGMPDPPPADWWEWLLAVVDLDDTVKEMNEENNAFDRCFGAGCPN